MAPNRSSHTASENGSGVASRLRIMVVDDEPDTVLTLLALLREEGYEADGFASGKSALEALVKLDRDVIISDIAMATPNGHP